MTGSPHFSNYPMTGSRLTYIICVLGAAACGVAIKGGTAVGAIGFAFVVVFVILARRTGTATSQAGITVRGLLRTQTIAWAEIQDIRVKVNPVGRAETEYTKGAPKQLVTVYDNHGKRTVLPNINEETLRKGRSLEAEVEHYAPPGNCCEAKNGSPCQTSARSPARARTGWPHQLHTRTSAPTSPARRTSQARHAGAPWGYWGDSHSGGCRDGRGRRSCGET